MAGQLTIDILKASSGVLATQNGMTGICKAWARFTVSGGSTVVVNKSFNVSSITYVSTGRYTMSFTSAMADTYYTIAGAVNSSGIAVNVYGGTETVNSVDVLTASTGGGTACAENMVAVFGN